jgi:outer membrane protein TolC
MELIEGLRFGFAFQTKGPRVATVTAILIASAFAGCAQNATTSLFNQPHASKTAPETLTLKDALAMAEKNDPSVLAAAGDAASANEDRKQARAALYPSLSGRSEYLGTQGNGKLPESRFVTNDGVHVYRDWAVVHQDLSPGVLSGTGIQRATAAQALAHAKLEVARRGLAAAVTKNYYALIVAQRKYANAQTALDQAHKSLTISQDLERGREVAHSDVIRSQLLEIGQQQTLQEAKLAMENARLDLAVLLFRDFNEGFALVDDLDVAPALPSLNESEDMASRNNPTLAAAIENLRSSRLDVKLARQAFLPTLTVDAVYGIEANAFALHSTVASAKQDGPLPNLGYFITASLNVPVWDWGVRRSKLKQSELRREEAEADLSASQRTLVRNLQVFYDEAQVAHDQLDLLRRAVDLASENLRLNTLRYQAGETAIVDLVDAQTSAIHTRNAYDEGMVRYRLAMANLQTITGVF